MSIEPHRVYGYCVCSPFRVSINGILVRDKSGNPKKFHTMLGAMSWAQRHLQKKARKVPMDNHAGCHVLGAAPPPEEG